MISAFVSQYYNIYCTIPNIALIILYLCMNNFGMKIKELRKQRKMTAQTLANEVGLTVPSVYRIESGKFTPSIPTLNKIARALDCTVEVIIRPV